MKKLSAVIFILIYFSSNIFAQDSLTIKNLENRVELLSQWVGELISKVDSLEQSQKALNLEFARYKWNLIKEGMDWSEVVAILGPPDKEEPAKFGTVKYIYGTGFVGYVLLDKEKKVISSNPPLELRMKM